MRGWPIERKPTLQIVDHDKDGTRLCGTAAAQYRRRSLCLAAAKIGCHPEIGTQAHFIILSGRQTGFGHQATQRIFFVFGDQPTIADNVSRKDDCNLAFHWAECPRDPKRP